MSEIFTAEEIIDVLCEYGDDPAQFGKFDCHDTIVQGDYVAEYYDGDFEEPGTPERFYLYTVESVRIVFGFVIAAIAPVNRWGFREYELDIRIVALNELREGDHWYIVRW